jgi:tRNA (guanine-N7-)-methyltransferase
MDWSSHYPHGDPKDGPHILDMGCGFGGLTVALSTLLPHKRILGMEIRAKVAEYVRLRILACRQEQPGSYDNCSVLRGNSMKYMPNFFRKASLDKIFICFPDPHFKRKNHPRRIVSDRLLSEYAFFLNPQGGRLYTITDVEELHHWHLHKCRAHPLFRELTTDELDADPCVQLMYSETEEGKKVQRCKGNKYYAVFERLSDTESVWKEPLFVSHNFWNMGTDESTVDE